MLYKNGSLNFSLSFCMCYVAKMICLTIAIIIAAISADASRLPLPNREYLPPFKPDEQPSYNELENTAAPESSNLVFAPTKDIYIPPVRLPLMNEIYGPLSNTNPAIRPINQSPIVNSANYPPYYQTTSQDLIYPSNSKHPVYSANNNYYAQQTQSLYHSGLCNPNPVKYPPQQYPTSGPIYKPASNCIQPGEDHQSEQNSIQATTHSPAAVPDFAKPPVATTFPPPKFKPFIHQDPNLNISILS